MKLTSPQSINFDWNWENQLKSWNSHCFARNYLQSPINIFPRILETDNTIVSNFKIDVSYNKVDFFVVNNQNELIVQFLSNGGSFTMSYNNAWFQFQPTGLYFRFPAENTIEGKRHDGEIVIEHTLVEQDQVSRLEFFLHHSFLIYYSK